MSPRFPDWSHLPEDPLRLILDLLPLADYIRFGAVCKSWQSVQTGKGCPLQLPWLVLRDDDGSYENSTRCFFSLSEQITHQMNLPELRGRFCCGSSQGWLVTIDEDLKMNLFHPFSRVQINLPCLPGDFVEWDDLQGERRYLRVHKAVLSCDPVLSPRECVVMVIHGPARELAFCRPGDEKWTAVLSGFIDFSSDIIFLAGQFYCVTVSGCTIAVRVGPCYYKAAYFSPPLHVIRTLRTIRRYLVESKGDLLHLVRYLNVHNDEHGAVHYVTAKFQVYRRDGDQGEWVSVKSIGDQAVFLGSNSSIALSASDFPGCKGNAIYFTDDNYNYYRCFKCWCVHENLGVYRLENGKIELCYPKDAFDPTFSLPIWWKPSPPYK